MIYYKLFNILYFYKEVQYNSFLNYEQIILSFPPDIPQKLKRNYWWTSRLQTWCVYSINLISINSDNTIYEMYSCISYYNKQKLICDTSFTVYTNLSETSKILSRNQKIIKVNTLNIIKKSKRTNLHYRKV